MNRERALPSLLPYQARWLADGAGLKVIEKARRVGISWAEAYDAVMHAGAAGGGNVYYQAYNWEMTRGFIADCADWARTLQLTAGSLGETLIDEGQRIQAFRIAFASGREILAMTSAPRAFRSKGRPGDLAIIDEAAFVDDLGQVLKAAMAFRVWGGRAHVISTHNGEANPFAALCRDLREGARPGSLHRITLEEALAEGLFRKIAAAQGRPWSAAGRGRLGSRDQGGVRHSRAGRARLHPRCRRRRLARLGGDPHLRGPRRRRSRRLRRRFHHDRRGRGKAPRSLGRRGAGAGGRRALAARTGGATGHPLQRSSGRSWATWPRAIGPVRIAVDQTGMGEAVVEQLQEDLGRTTVEGVLMTGPRRLDTATALREAVEDRRLRIPPDGDLRRDLHAVRAEAGLTGAPRLMAERSGTDGHADRFWALALACAAARTATTAPIEGATAGPRAATLAGFY